MPTTCRAALVSFAAALTLGLGACASVQSPPLSSGTLRDAGHLAIRFDNGERDYVRVYLVGEKREWLLGRVEPGAIATLVIPDDALGESSTFVRLAVLTGRSATLEAARDPRARFTVAQPAASILSQQWSYSQGELTSLRRP